MDFGALGSLSFFLLSKGGVQSISDLRTLIDAAVSFHNGKAKVSDLLTSQNLDAVQRLLVLFATCVQDSNCKTQITNLITSLKK